MPIKKNFRKRNLDVSDSENRPQDTDGDEEEDRRLALEEVKFLQKQRQRKWGIPAIPSPVAASKSISIGGLSSERGGLVEKATEGSGDTKDELVLQDTFAQETAVTVEDPNMLKYVEQELAKKRGKNIKEGSQVESELKRVEDELYKIPEHLKVKKRSSEESSTQWTTGIAEVQLPIEYKLRNIEETEAAKKLLHEKRLVGKSKASEVSIPSSFSADYSQRGRELAEKLRAEKAEGRDDRGGAAGIGGDIAGNRPAATDEFMLERFRKRERYRVMRR